MARPKTKVNLAMIHDHGRRLELLTKNSFEVPPEHVSDWAEIDVKDALVEDAPELEFDKESEAWAYLEGLIADGKLSIPDGDFAVVRMLKRRTLTQKPTLV